MNIADELFYNGKKYIKLAIASERSGLPRDLLDKQCRQKKLEAERVDDQWFILESAISRLLPVTNHLHPGMLQSSVVTLTKMSGALAGLIGVLAYLTLVSVLPNGLLEPAAIVNSQLIASGNQALEQTAFNLDQTAHSLTWGVDQLSLLAGVEASSLEFTAIQLIAGASDVFLANTSQLLEWISVQTEQIPFAAFLTKERLLTGAVIEANLSSTTVLGGVTSFSDRILEWASKVIDFVANLWSQIKNNWLGFFGREVAVTKIPEAPAAPTPSGLSQIQADIKDIKTGISEILRRLPAGGSVPTTNTLPNQGVVVLPQGSSTPEALKNKVAEMFSDKVEVNVDPSGKAGVVTPIFRDGAGEDYIFVLTPIKQ